MIMRNKSDVADVVFEIGKQIFEILFNMVYSFDKLLVTV